MDGFTVTLKLTAPVNPGVTNHIKIAIADGGDASYDSNLLIAGDSVQTALVAGDDEVTVQEGDSTTLDVLSNDDQSNGAQLQDNRFHARRYPAGITASTVGASRGGRRHVAAC